MTGAETELARMIRELAAFPTAERDEVLRLLGDDAAAAVLPRLQVLAETRWSPALAGLLSDIEEGDVDGITPAAVAALSDIADPPRHRSPEPVAEIGTRGNGRLTDWLSGIFPAGRA